MLICGLKLTHDGTVALLDDDKLLLSVEIEKVGNNPRYSTIHDLQFVQTTLQDFGYQLRDVDQFTIDGWDGRLNSVVEVADHGRPAEILTAPYHENQTSDVFLPGYLGDFSLGGVERRYESFFHVSSHLASAYCTSPFAVAQEPSMALVWDGGMFPRLYYVDPCSGTVENGGSLFPLIGHAYAIAGHHFGPWRRAEDAMTADDLSVAGKLMAYIALGSPKPDIKDVLYEQFDVHFAGSDARARSFRAEIGGWGTASEPSVVHLHPFYRSVAHALEHQAFTDEDVLASVHEFLEELLVSSLCDRIRAWKGSGPWNLCFAGGCALNIKWNSALRSNSLFTDVWVPPFPNDSGAALGTAVCSLVRDRGLVPIEWHTRSGPWLGETAPASGGWLSGPCSPERLAGVLHETGLPVVLLNGRAELGPRALGGRSILAAAVEPDMKDTLNRIKLREPYRPVAPICLVDLAPQVFDPGSPDPHMLFDHRVRPEWVERLPAIVHLDGTARLQTVSASDDPLLEKVLAEYHRLSGVPVLCNTSANLNGRGFFPDVASAMEWGGVDLIWSDGTLFRRVAV